MSVINLRNNIIQTIAGKLVILLLNFAIVVFSARLWGTEGRGTIVLFLANLSLMTSVTNIFTGGSVSYFLSKYGISKLISQAYLWVFIVAVTLGVAFRIYDQSTPSTLLFIVAILVGFTSFHFSLFIGDQRIGYFNLITVIQPAVHICSMLLFYYFVDKSYFTYFYGMIVSYAMVFIICKLLVAKKYKKITYRLDKSAIKQVFLFGWQIELSNFLQFFNYRLSYYFLGYYFGTASLGVFSIGVSISEAIWIVGRSISLVLYSNVVKQGNTEDSRNETKITAKYSFYISLLCLVLVLCLPIQVFSFVFGQGFEGVKQVVLLLSPGILAIAVSNVYGHFFSAIGKAKILILKSAAGVVATIVLAIWLIPTLQLTGACIVNACSYIVSSVILFWFFYRK
jgi:O-antigen/teichoic acid export membrane protein